MKKITIEKDVQIAKNIILERGDRIVVLSESRANYDWHVPSKEVLNAMYINKKKLNWIVPNANSMTKSNAFWSSTPYTRYVAWAQDFKLGNQFGSKMEWHAYLRPVRALPEGHAETENVFKFEGKDYQAYPESAPHRMDWVDAKRWCERLN